MAKVKFPKPNREHAYNKINKWCVTIAQMHALFYTSPKSVRVVKTTVSACVCACVRCGCTACVVRAMHTEIGGRRGHLATDITARLSHSSVPQPVPPRPPRLACPRRGSRGSQYKLSRASARERWCSAAVSPGARPQSVPPTHDAQGPSCSRVVVFCRAD